MEEPGKRDGVEEAAYAAEGFEVFVLEVRCNGDEEFFRKLTKW